MSQFKHSTLSTNLHVIQTKVLCQTSFGCQLSKLIELMLLVNSYLENIIISQIKYNLF